MDIKLILAKVIYRWYYIFLILQYWQCNSQLFSGGGGKNARKLIIADSRPMIECRAEVYMFEHVKCGEISLFHLYKRIKTILLCTIKHKKVNQINKTLICF